MPAFPQFAGLQIGFVLSKLDEANALPSRHGEPRYGLEVYHNTLTYKRARPRRLKPGLASATTAALGRVILEPGQFSKLLLVKGEHDWTRATGRY